MDLNGARRKNATRETTSTLKAWLYEHRKNPYPTKGEKIMLAIITKMTLTQGTVASKCAYGYLVLQLYISPNQMLNNSKLH